MCNHAVKTSGVDGFYVNDVVTFYMWTNFDLGRKCTNFYDNSWTICNKCFILYNCWYFNLWMYLYLRYFLSKHKIFSSQWLHNGRDGVSDNQHCDCLLNRVSRSRSKKTTKLRVTGLCAGNSPVTGEFPTQRASNAETVSIWWRHHALDNKSLATAINALRRFINAVRCLKFDVKCQQTQWWLNSVSVSIRNLQSDV